MSSDEAFEQAIAQQASERLGQMEKLAAPQLAKADSASKKLRRAFLLAEAKSMVWFQIVNSMEEESGMGEDPAGFAESLGLDSEEFAKSNAKSLLQKMAKDAKETAQEELARGDFEEDVLDELVKFIKQVKV
jgi:hypothetical protein